MAKKDKALEAAADAVNEIRSELRAYAPFEIELAGARFTEMVQPVGYSADKFTVDDRRKNDLRMFYCGAYIVFERPGFVAEAVSYSLCKGMTTLKDKLATTDDVVSRAETEKQSRAQAKVEEEKKRKLREEGERQEKLELLGKKALKGKGASGKGKADQGEEVTHSELEDEELNNPPPAAKVVPVRDIARDMAARGGTAMSDEETRSLNAAMKRNQARRGR